MRLKVSCGVGRRTPEGTRYVVLRGCVGDKHSQWGRVRSGRYLGSGLD